MQYSPGSSNLYGREQPSPAGDGEARFAREREPSLTR
jgi:hypothetical protein